MEVSENDGKEQCTREMWEYFAKTEQEQKFREDAEKERQTGIQGRQWRLESPAREYLEQVK